MLTYSGNVLCFLIYCTYYTLYPLSPMYYVIHSNLWGTVVRFE